MGMATTESQFHVLAVDDNIIDRKLIERLLKTSSYQVTTVDSGTKALELLGFHQVDESNPNSPSMSSTNNHQVVEVNLIITDYCMPGMTGYDLLKKIKESSSLRNIPVVIMSSENVPSRINRCLEEGAEEFFLKPVRLSDVNKLRPHLMKTKTKDQTHDHKQEFKDENDGSDMPGSRSFEKEQNHLQQEQETPPQQQQQQQQQQRQQQEAKQQQQSNTSMSTTNNKRKIMEERLSPDRTRPRFDGIITMV